MGTKITKITPELLTRMMVDESAWRVSEGFPKDVKAAKAGYNPDRETFYLVVEHESFPEISEAEAMETFHVEIDVLEQVDDGVFEVSEE